MKKRGQATVFIILGIVILALFGLLFFLRGNLVSDLFNIESTKQYESADIEPVKDVISNCVELTLLDGVEWVSNHGGYFNPVDSQKYSRDAGEILVSYSWGKDLGSKLPTLQGLGEQINLYMKEHSAEIEGCIDSGLIDYKKSWTITNEKSFSLETPQISDNIVRQKINYDTNQLSVKKDDYAATAKEIMAEVEIALGQAQRMAVEISSCFNGDYLPTNFNTYCNNGGVPFRAELYNMKYPNNVVRMLHQDCGRCDDCYVLLIPNQGGDIVFNVALRIC
ncbi:hypothetical protein J4438_01385 [Candidatus Woesearchaeota archaeon]|nr:hypothetical protein [Candidatus Woesearchaeota archaeon]